MVRDLDISLLRAFVFVATAGSMTAAAEKLNLTQGAVSQRIARLEETLQSALFDRRNRRLILTRKGEQLLGMARKLLETNDKIVQEIMAGQLGGEVRLGLPHELVTTYLPRALEGFVKAYPDIEVTLVTGSSPELRSAIERGALDVAIAEDPLTSDNAEKDDRECLSVERLLWIGNRRGGASLKRPLPLSLITETCAFRTVILEALRQTDIPWRTVFENGTLETTMTTVRADLAVSASLASAVPDDLDVLGPETGLPELPSFSINLYVNKTDASPAAKELAHYLRATAVTDHKRSA